jgi:eukaryotic-like serine/threonine-protein kinase
VSEPRPPLNKRCHVCGYRYESTVADCPCDNVPLGKPRPGAEDLGPYRLVERLATGGMGAVYRAVHQKAGRAVALKLLHQSLRNEVVGVSRFFHEARAVNTIRHPNVVEVYDLSGEGEDVYMVLELLSGIDLRTLLGQQPRGCLPAGRVVHILEQVCGALQATHARKIVHRDLKPENIFLCNHTGRQDFVKLLDFGVAKLERPEGRLTREGIALGTPEYMAPEQARGADVDGRTDLYAVGCIAFEMLTGRTLFQGAAPGDVMMKHVRTPPPSPRDLVPTVPPALEAVVLRCLAKSPRARPQTAMELAQELCAAVGLPFDETGAFRGWKEWGTEPISSVVEMPALEVRARRGRNAAGLLRDLLGQVRSKRRLALPAAAVVVVALGAWQLVTAARRGPGATALPVAQARAAQPALADLVVQSTPLAAEVFDEAGTRLGVTPYRLSLAPGTALKLRLQRAGYRPVERLISAESPERTILVPLEPDPAPRPAKPRAQGGRIKSRGRKAAGR